MLMRRDEERERGLGRAVLVVVVVLLEEREVDGLVYEDVVGLDVDGCDAVTGSCCCCCCCCCSASRRAIDLVTIREPVLTSPSPSLLFSPFFLFVSFFFFSFTSGSSFVITSSFCFFLLSPGITSPNPSLSIRGTSRLSSNFRSISRSNSSYLACCFRSSSSGST